MNHYSLHFFSPFLCNQMDLFAAEVQVKIKKQECL